MLSATARLASLVFIFILVFSCSDESANDASKVPDLVRSQRVKISNLNCGECDYIVPTGTTNINGKEAGIKPGDVVCFNAALKYGMITFEEMEGTVANPITFTNCDGEVTINSPGSAFVVRFNQSKHIRFTGGDNDGEYGIKLTGAEGNGLVMGYLSTNFEVDHIEVYEVGFAGVMAKTDPTCDDATIRSNYTMRDVLIHHNYMHETHGEGFYIGHSSYSGKETDCGIRLPHLIENIKVFNNLIRNTGWDGLQVSCATKGAEIYNNTIENYATENKPAQSSGICVGGGTGGLCYNNYIRKGTGPAIAVFGLADNIIHNNIIIDAGKAGIFCDERTEPGKGYQLLHNTIINPKEHGMLLYSNKVPKNIVVNNIVINPGYLAKEGNEAYLQTLGNSVVVEHSNNHFSPDMKGVSFIDAEKGNYKLSVSSPLINAGKDISNFKISKDFYNEQRLKGTRYDIGASEAN